MSGIKYLRAYKSALCHTLDVLTCTCLSTAFVLKHNAHHAASVSHGSVQWDLQLSTSAAQRSCEITGAKSTSNKVIGGGTDSRNCIRLGPWPETGKAAV